MSWPLSQDYNEAIQSPGRNFSDPDLRGGEVAVNALGLPQPCSGNFADVYEVRCPDGQRWAVKCFTREVAGLHQRYEAISNHLRRAKLPFTVDFSYLDEGIRVRGQWFPVLKMQWVEGLTLNQFIGRYADKPAYLEALLQIWLRMSKKLRAEEVGHCDLQHGNVLLVPGAGANSLALKLVDYDGMWVPALAGGRSGEVGHPSYQHPQRLRDQTYSLDVDRFPLLLIATGLRAVTVKGRALWDKYDNGDNLLFRQTDLQAPTKSFLFLDLLKSGDGLTALLADHLLRSLRGGLASAPLLEEVIPEAPAPATTVRVARPVAVPAEESQGGAAVTVKLVPVATVHSRAVVRRPVRKKGGARTAAWVAAVALLLAALGAGWVLYRAIQNDRGGAATGPALALNRPDPDPESVATRRVLPAATEPATEYKETAKVGDPVKPPPPEKPKDTEKPRATERPKSTGKPKDTGKPNKPPAVAQVKEKLVNSLGMVLVGIHEGKFRMGSPRGEAGRNADEGPQHEVRITQPFYMGKYPVTKGEFAAFAQAASYQTEAEQKGDKATWRNPGFEQGDNDPVVLVTWNDAVEFCKWLSKKEGRAYALPTEAQWEYACRAGKQTAYFYGDDPAKLDDHAWFKANSKEQTHPVGSMLPNAWRLYDMAGNIRQWCRDGMRAYSEEAADDPTGPEAVGGQRAFRGGDWGSAAEVCRCAARMQRDLTQRTNHSGFRVVCEP
jgi:formylglycine-generating enzyme required for sulfatase activity